MSKVFCFYHSADHDGHVSGAIVRLNEPDAIMCQINYGDKFPWNEISSDDTVYMVDFGLQPFSDMVKLNKSCNLIWIDHHATALDDMVESGVQFKGIQKTGRGACELTWNYFYPDKSVPRALDLLSKHDVFDLVESQILDFEYGMRTYDLNPRDENNLELLKILLFPEDHENSDITIDSIAERGKVVWDFLRVFDGKYNDLALYEVKFEGLRCLALNRLLCGSFPFDRVKNREDYDAFIAYGWVGDTWSVGFYSDRKDIDVSAVCARHGGGGHVSTIGSCGGFQTRELPPEFFPEKTEE